MGSPVNTISSKLLSNLIINGAMRHDQRREGGLFTLTSGASTQYVCDRWRQDRDVSATTVTSRSSLNPPNGFSHFQRISVTTGVSVTALQYSEWIQQVESSNTVNLKFGTAEAESLGLSFWVRGSIVGANSGVVRNNAGRSYVFSFTINSANTWEYKEITIPGDVGGTWVVGDPASSGLVLGFCHSAGTSYRTTPGSWQSGLFVGATGGNNLTSVTGATYDLTGVQLKIGAPREFEHRSFLEEIALCQRYYWKQLPQGVGFVGPGINANSVYLTGRHPVKMRVGALVVGTTGTYAINNGGNFISTNTTPVATGTDTDGFIVQINGFTGLTSGAFYQQTFAGAPTGQITADAEF